MTNPQKGKQATIPLGKVPFYEDSAVKSKLRIRLVLLLCTYPGRRPQNRYSAVPFGRQSHASKTHRHTSARLATVRLLPLVLLSQETTNCHASDWRLRVSGPAPRWPRPCARCLRQTSIRVGSRLCPCGQQAEHHNLYSPTGDPPKPGTGTTLLSRGGLSARPRKFRSPGPVLDATLPSSPLFRYVCPPVPVC
jgi:hypothetical protein